MAKKPARKDPNNWLKVIDGTGKVVEEPDWEAFITDDLDLAKAKDHWRIITTELTERNLLSANNAHLIQRLICAYLVYDTMFAEISEHGVVQRANPKNLRSISRVSPHYSAMRDAASDATSLEAELGLTPRRRGDVTEVKRKSNAARPSERFLSGKVPA